MKRIVFDCETDNLLPLVTKVHCLVLRDLETGQVLSCAEQPGYSRIRDGLAALSKAERVYGHNVIDFDLPALEKVYGFRLPDSVRVMDTLTTVRMRWAHIKDSDFNLFRSKKLPGQLIGSHSLKAWGYRLGLHKGEYDGGWENWSKAMQDYCVQDTAVTAAIVARIRAAGVSPESVETEHELAFYLREQEANGFPFDFNSAIKLQAMLASKRQEVHVRLTERFGTYLVPSGEFVPKVNNAKLGYTKGVPVSKVKVIHFNPSSRDHIINRLSALYGWTPTEFTEKGKPKLDDDILAAMPYPEAADLAEHFLLSKRLGSLSEGNEAWLKVMDKNKPRGGVLTGQFHIHGRINQSGAITHRASHMKPNMSAVPKVTAPYGTESRSLFVAPPGFQLLGADASGLELRCLAHYMAKYDDGEYAQVILTGDPHSVNRDALGLSGKEGRDKSKTYIYAWLYGAGDEKLGSILDPTATPAQQAKLGKASRVRFLKGLPAMKLLVDGVKASATKHGYLTLLDGRRTYTRSDHSALNSLLQSAGAIICKRWIVTFNRQFLIEFGPQGWDKQWAACAWSHDEVQLGVRPAIAERAAVILVESIRSLTDHFKLRIPLDGEAKLGPHWAATH